MPDNAWSYRLEGAIVGAMIMWLLVAATDRSWVGDACDRQCAPAMAVLNSADWTCTCVKPVEGK